MNAISKALILLCASCLASGCSSLNTSMFIGMYKDSPAQNWLYIHKDPKVGDYAVQRLDDGSLAMRHEVVSLQGTMYEIRSSFVEGDPYLRSVAWHYMVTQDGQVKKAFLRDSRNGEDHHLRIAAEGEDGYIDPHPVSLNQSEIIKVKVGEYSVNEIVVYELTALAGLLGKNKMTHVNFIHPGVKFGIVKTVETNAVDLTLLDVMNQVVSTKNRAAGSLMSYMIGKLKESKSIPRIWETIETN